MVPKTIVEVGIVLFLLIPEAGAASGRAKSEVKRGNLLYNKKDFSGAAERYLEALRSAPESDIVNFDLGAGLYKSGDYAGAVKHFEKALLTEDENLEQKASFNTGNAKYKYGISQEDSNVSEAVNLLEEALHHYERARELEPEDKDSKHNYELVKKELERLRQKLEQAKQESQEKKEPESKQEQTQQQRSESAQAQEQESQGQQAQERPAQPEQKQEKQEQQEQAAQEKEKKQEAKTAQSQAGQEQKGAMSEKEARMMLEAYRMEDEPRGLYRPKIPVRTSGVEKDW